jgi:hypothetical protein
MFNPTKSKIDLVRAALPGTANDISKRSGCSAKTALVWLKHLEHLGEVHIGHWEAVPHGGRPTAFYAKGPGTNAPMPPKSKNADALQAIRDRRRMQMRAYRARDNSRFDEPIDAVTQRIVTSWTSTPARDPLQSAFFGAPL